jgi:hypothetical protein
LHRHAKRGCSSEAIDMTMGCITQEEPSQGHTVGVALEK